MPSNNISNHGELRSFEFKFQFIYTQLFNYNTTTIRKKKEEVETELTVHWIKHNKGKKCVAAKGAKLLSRATTTERLQVGGDYTVLIKK